MNSMFIILNQCTILLLPFDYYIIIYYYLFIILLLLTEDVHMCARICVQSVIGSLVISINLEYLFI